MDHNLKVSRQIIYKPIEFTDREILAFNAIACNGIISVSTNSSKPSSSMWVNFVILSNYVKQHIHYWSKAAHVNTPLGIEQYDVHMNLLLKIEHIHNLAIRHSCVIDQWVNLQKLLKITTASRKANFHLARFPHNEFDILEIEKVGLEHSNMELEYDMLDEEHITDLILLSKLMSSQLHGLEIF